MKKKLKLLVNGMPKTLSISNSIEAKQIQEELGQIVLHLNRLAIRARKAGVAYLDGYLDAIYISVEGCAKELEYRTQNGITS